MTLAFNSTFGLLFGAWNLIPAIPVLTLIAANASILIWAIIPEEKQKRSEQHD